LLRPFCAVAAAVSLFAPQSRRGINDQDRPPFGAVFHGRLVHLRERVTAARVGRDGEQVEQVGLGQGIQPRLVGLVASMSVATVNASLSAPPVNFLYFVGSASGPTDPPPVWSRSDGS